MTVHEHISRNARSMDVLSKRVESVFGRMGLPSSEV